MVPNVRYYCILQLANHSCPNHIICITNHFFHYLSLLQKFKRIQAGNGQYVNILFIIPIIVDIHGHRFEVYSLVSEIHENVDLVL